MKIALIGYGKMGKTIEQIALDRGHTIVAIIDKENVIDLKSAAFKTADVAIEFTQPSTAFTNLLACFEVGVPVVCGTTGWLHQLDEAKKSAATHETALFYASNYSLGVNIFFHLNKVLAQMMQRFENYDVRMQEIHHIHKLDAPSGTALSAAHDILQSIERKKTWSLESQDQSVLHIDAKRIDEAPGTHTVYYDSSVDQIEITHTAHNRSGFAMGAVVAAEFLAGKKGFFTMSDVLGF